MKLVKTSSILILVVSGGLFGWHHFASMVNNHIDQAAVAIIIDSMTTSNIHHLEKMKE